MNRRGMHGRGMSRRRMHGHGMHRRRMRGRGMHRRCWVWRRRSGLCTCWRGRGGWRRVGRDRRTDRRRYSRGSLHDRRLGFRFRLTLLRSGFHDGGRFCLGFHLFGPFFCHRRCFFLLAMVLRAILAIADRLDSETYAQLVGDIFIDRARVRQLLRHTEFGEEVQNQVGLHLQLARKHVDTDLLHKQTKCKRGES